MDFFTLKQFWSVRSVPFVCGISRWQQWQPTLFRVALDFAPHDGLKGLVILIFPLVLYVLAHNLNLHRIVQVILISHLGTLCFGPQTRSTQKCRSLTHKYHIQSQVRV